MPYYGMLTNDIGYFQLAGFTVDAGKEVRMALTKLKEQGAKKIVFDIRDNPGGLLNESVNIANLFVEKGLEEHPAHVAAVVVVEYAVVVQVFVAHISGL